MQAGATSQFSAVPLNLAAPGATADHIVTGSWSKKAAEEAAKYARVHVAAKGDNKSLPAIVAQALTPGAAYVHYCDNETIQVGIYVPFCMDLCGCCCKCSVACIRKDVPGQGPGALARVQRVRAGQEIHIRYAAQCSAAQSLRLRGRTIPPLWWLNMACNNPDATTGVEFLTRRRAWGSMRCRMWRLDAGGQGVISLLLQASRHRSLG